MSNNRNSYMLSPDERSILDMYVDAKDNMNNWCVAKILEYDP